MHRGARPTAAAIGKICWRLSSIAVLRHAGRKAGLRTAAESATADEDFAEATDEFFSKT